MAMKRDIESEGRLTQHERRLVNGVCELMSENMPEKKPSLASRSGRRQLFHFSLQPFDFGLVADFLRERQHLLVDS